MAEVTPGLTAAPTDSARPREGRSLDTVFGHLPRGDRRSSKPPSLDPGLPVLLVRVGRYPIHHGAVGVIRTLGRAGVPVYAVTDQGLTPTSISRYLTGQVKLSSGGKPDQSALLEALIDAIEQLPAMPMLVCTDDEAAVLVAEGADVLAGRAIFPAVPPDLPRQLASKRGLYEICRRFGVPTPAAWWAKTADDLEEALANIALPVIVKQADPWNRLTRPAIKNSTVVRSAKDVESLMTAFQRWPDGAAMVGAAVPARRALGGLVRARILFRLFAGIPNLHRPQALVVARTGRSDRLRQNREERGDRARRARAVPVDRLPRHLRHGLAVRPKNRYLLPARLQSSRRRPIPYVRGRWRHGRRAGDAPRPLRAQGQPWSPGRGRAVSGRESGFGCSVVLPQGSAAARDSERTAASEGSRGSASMTCGRSW